MSEEQDKGSARFFYYAKGSCGELRTQIYIGIEIGYIKKEVGFQWKDEVEQLSKRYLPPLNQEALKPFTFSLAPLA